MSRNPERTTWFEALGGLSDYLGGDDDVNIAQSRVVDTNSHPVGSQRDCSNAKVAEHGSTSPRLCCDCSTNRDVAGASSATSSAAYRAPKTPSASLSLRKHAKRVNELQARVIHRARAYEALTQAAPEVEGPATHNEGPNRPPRHPVSMSPGLATPVTFTAASEYDEATPSSTRTSFNVWKPGEPVYAQPSSDWETESDSVYRGALYVAPLSRYDAYQPAPPPPPSHRREQRTQQQQNRRPEVQPRKSRPPPLNLYEAPMRDASENESDHSAYTYATYSSQSWSADSGSRSGIQSSRIAKHHDRNHDDNRQPSQVAYEPYRHSVTSAPRAEVPSSSSFTGTGQGRRMPIPSPITYSSNPSPLPSATPSPRCDRDPPSPSRGAWTSDHPRQRQPSFLRRTTRRLNQNIDTNLQRARMRSPSSFEVRRVQKSPVKDIVAAETKLTGPTRQPSGPGAKYKLPVEMPFSMEWLKEHRERRDGVSGHDAVPDESREPRRRSEDISGLEERVRRYHQRKKQQQLEQLQQQLRSSYEMERDRDSPVGGSTSELSRSDSLFLEGRDRDLSSPASDTFFVSRWSKQQALHRAQDSVFLAPSHTSHHDPFGADQPRARSDKGQQTDTAISRGPTSFRERARSSFRHHEARPRHDLGFLPSQSRENTPQPVFLDPNEPLTESPEPIRPPSQHKLTRKRGTRHLRRTDK
ncbi:hypothetical protein F5Y05DRAFT_396059 [Hypoxylon sp. FL0543]|nr:hypothetical protein F5Y05DRAFT_396059 [Hypoxylon sp. FL0543]